MEQPRPGVVGPETDGDEIAWSISSANDVPNDRVFIIILAKAIATFNDPEGML
jgi:hypothetical protein